MRMPRFDRNPRSALARAQRSFVFRTAERIGAGLVAGDQTRTAIAADATIATIVVATENATDKIAKDIGGPLSSLTGSSPGKSSHRTSRSQCSSTEHATIRRNVLLPWFPPP
jgi:hypothetical protein